MKKILIAVDDTKGSQNVLSVFHNFVQQPIEVSPASCREGFRAVPL